MANVYWVIILSIETLTGAVHALFLLLLAVTPTSRYWFLPILEKGRWKVQEWNDFLKVSQCAKGRARAHTGLTQRPMLYPIPVKQEAWAESYLCLGNAVRSIKAVKKKKAYPGLGEHPWRGRCGGQPHWALPGLLGPVHMRRPHRLGRFWGGQSYSHLAFAGWHQSPPDKSPFATEEANCLATIQSKDC